MRVHFIATGGAVMHNLAIALHRKGFQVSGSDDKIADPAKTNLEKEGLLPDKIGFFEDKITADIDAIILGMHARKDNPELLKAQALNIPIYSFPEYIYEYSKNKTRIVIAGSHGKTSITAMVMHVLQHTGREIDYMVGAKVKGFDTSVKLTDTAPIIVLEGDEYLASPINMESKFMFYHPDIALISGVAWDHINVFPVYAEYVNQFKKFAESVQQNGTITYFAQDEVLQEIFNNYHKKDVKVIAYDTPRYEINNGITTLITTSGKYTLKVFGEHNLQNIEGAKKVCKAVGVSESDFYTAISSFEGAANRLQYMAAKADVAIYKDFAHSPSKLRATVAAMKKQFGNRALVAVMELHTFSSLNENFLKEYKGALDECTTAIVFIDDEALQLKQMQKLDPELIKKSFNREDLNIFTDSAALEDFLLSQKWENKNLLLMSSGQFGGMDIQNLVNKIM